MLAAVTAASFYAAARGVADCSDANAVAASCAIDLTGPEQVLLVAILPKRVADQLPLPAAAAMGVASRCCSC